MKARNKYITSLYLSFALLLAPITGYANHDNNDRYDCSRLTLGLDCTEHRDTKEKMKKVAKVVGVGRVVAVVSNVFDGILGMEGEEMSLKLQEYSSGKGWRLSEMESPIRVSFLPKKNDYINPYQENNTNMSYNFEKKERMILSVNYDF